MEGESSTVYKHVDTCALLVGGDGPLATRVTATFDKMGIRVVRVADVAVACAQLAEMMPQMVVALRPLVAGERAALADPVAAVGALLMDLDPALDDETLDALLERAAEATIEKNLVRDEPVTRQENHE